MNKYLNIALAGCMALSLIACSKDDDGGGSSGATLEEMEAATADNFGNSVALASYADLETASNNLYNAVIDFTTTPSDDKLNVCRDAWRSMRSIWEGSEGYLFGPVEDNEYDPKMDTWPTDYAEMNVLLNDSLHHPLDVADIESLDYSLRGYHPIEYMLWGVNSNKTAAEFTSRQVKYLTSLAEDVKNLCTQLHSEWTEGFTDEVTTAGAGSTSFPTYFDFLTTLNNGMIGICNEVGHSDENTGKIWEPFNLRDSSIVESPYSENSMTDFKNNIQGAYNVYLGKYGNNDGTSITDIVASLNKDLDNRIKAQFDNALASFNAINGSFEQAIFNQRPQLETLMTAIGGVRDILEGDLQSFLVTNIKN